MILINKSAPCDYMVGGKIIRLNGDCEITILSDEDFKGLLKAHPHIKNFIDAGYITVSNKDAEDKQNQAEIDKQKQAEADEAKRKAEAEAQAQRIAKENEDALLKAKMDDEKIEVKTDGKKK